MGFLLAILPDEALPLLLVGAAIAVMLGLMAARTLVGLVIGLIVIAALAPFLGAIVAELPLFWLAIVVLVVGVLLARSMFGLLIGRGATERLMAHLAYAVVCAPFRLVGSLVRLVVSGRTDPWRR